MKKRIPWNKGLTKETDSRLNYNRPTTFKKGERRSKLTEFKKGMNPHNKGKSKGWISQGYKFFQVNGKTMSEHKMVWLRDSEWNMIPEGFVIHHINGNKLDNRIENLACIPNEYHKEMHWALEKQQNINRYKPVGGN